MTDQHEQVNFLDLGPQYRRPESSRFAVLPIPYEGTVSYGKGSAAAPEAITRASTQVELYDEDLGGEYYQDGIFSAQPVDCRDTEPEEVQRRIQDAAEKLLIAGKFVLGLGGEHSVTAALVRAAAQHWPGLSVLQLDAHADLRGTYQSSKYSHACVMRRVRELSLPTVAVGIRSYSAAEKLLLEDSSHSVITARQVAESRRDKTTRQQWMNSVIGGLSDSVYVTVDIDAFDPSQAPGTGTPEPGGLDFYEVTDLLRLVVQSRKIISADIVEVIPRPHENITEFLAARLAYKIIAYSKQS